MRADIWWMQVNRHSDLTEALQVLVGKRLSGVGQAAGMGVFEFGEPTTGLDGVSGQKVQGSEYAIHVQCAFRLARNGFVVRGSDDYRWSKGPDDSMRTMFDLRAEAIDQSLAKPPYTLVDEVAVSSVGDVRVGLSGGLEIGVFVNSSRPTEQWRFLCRFGDHTVFPAT